MKNNPKVLLAGAVVVVALILFGTYNFLYSASIEDADKIANECKKLEARKEELNQKTMMKPVYEEGIENSTKIIDTVLKKYGPGFKPEKTIMTVVDLCNSTGASVKSITFTDNETLYSNPGTTNEDGEVSSGNVLFKSNSSIVFSSSYSQLKKIFDFVNNYPERMNVESFSLGYNRDSGIVSGDIVLNLYGVTDANHVYVDPEIPDIEIGTNNIFGQLPIPEVPEGEEGAEGTEGTGEEGQKVTE